MGRLELIKLPHWSYEEMFEAFGFTPDKYVYYGGYPGAADLINDEQRWKSYIRDSIIEPTISKDILQLIQIQKPALLKNLFELSCIYAGEILSYNKILGQLIDAGNTTTLTQYQNILDEIWLIKGIQKFSGSQIKIRSSIPKWLVYNTALSSMYEELDFKALLKNPVKWGRKVELAIGAYLLNSARINNFKVFYSKDVNDEIDFIIQKGNSIVPIEVKIEKVKFHKGLINFTKKYKVHRTILISNDAFNWQDFLKLNINDLF